MEQNAVFFKWTDKMSVNFEEIDNQHKKLVDFLNEMYSAFMNREHKEKVGSIIDQMTKYAVYHFETEEKYFVAFSFHGTAEHIVEHNDFRQKVLEFAEKYKQNNSALTYNVMNFLRNWLTNHIMDSDRKYIECFTRNGLK
jgi:hemerythrin-like metal-binding protein